MLLETESSVTNSIMQSPSWEDDNSWNGQEVLRIL
jgi:hypothetical protein